MIGTTQQAIATVNTAVQAVMGRRANRRSIAEVRPHLNRRPRLLRPEQTSNRGLLDKGALAQDHLPRVQVRLRQQARQIDVPGDDVAHRVHRRAAVGEIATRYFTSTAICGQERPVASFGRNRRRRPGIGCGQGLCHTASQMQRRIH